MLGLIPRGQRDRRHKDPIGFTRFIVQIILCTRLRSSLYCQTLVNRYSMEPRRYFRLTPKPRSILVRSNKRFLSCIASLVLTRQHTEAQGEDLSLPPPHYFAERFRIA